MIQSDRQIRALCENPLANYEIAIVSGPRELGRSEHKTIPIYFPPENGTISRSDWIESEKKRILAEHENVLVDSAVPGMMWLLNPATKKLENPMISPYSPAQIREVPTVRNATDGIENDVYGRRKVISSGQSSYGYDVTLDNEFAIFTNINSVVIDPLNFDEKTLHKVVVDDYVLLPPNSYLLGRTKEWFNIPRDIVGIALGKSTYARCGAIVNVTPIEPGFTGHVVIEISNATSLPMKIYANQGIAQFMFYKGEPCQTSYADRDGGKGGKYQGQSGLTLAKS